jgi:SAM-dependent methyltransferase
MSRAPNLDQSTYWNEQAGPTWAELSPLLDRQIEAVGRRAVEALAPRPGERLLDVGCGCGATTLALAARVAPGGEAVGLDISRPMLEVARARLAAAGVAGARFVEGDAEAFDFAPERFDGLFSRFGVMFFSDPPAAFGNLLRALKPGGRMTFACWRDMAENPWMTAPLAAAGSLLPAAEPGDPDAPGPFALADAGRVRRILEAAGFAEVTIEPMDVQVGGNTLDDSLTLALRVGPLGARLREAPELAPVAGAVRAVLAAHLRGGVVLMDGAVWIVGARRPPAVWTEAAQPE